MPTRAHSPDVIVVGAGVIGLAVAWRARQRGLEVVVLERDRPGAGASGVAAGMLAPVAEVEFGDGGRRLLALGLRSVAMWPAFAAELERACGRTVGLSEAGTLLVARDEDEARELERQITLREALELTVRRLRPSEARELEPALAPTVRLALELPDDRSVDPRLVLAALRDACTATGVRLREGAAVSGLLFDGEHVSGVRLAAGELLRAPQTVVAAGAWAGQLEGLSGGAGVPVRPVKGQTLRLLDPDGPGLVRRSVRFQRGYLVPRADGRYVLGATVEERGFDRSPTAGGVYELLREARDLIPAVSEMQIEELSVGLRPGTPDNVAAIGRGLVPGLVWATGHYRNGILQAPLTAELVAGILTGARETADGEGDLSSLLAVCDPARFSSTEVDSDGQALPRVAVSL